MGSADKDVNGSADKNGQAKFESVDTEEGHIDKDGGKLFFGADDDAFIRYDPDATGDRWLFKDSTTGVSFKIDNQGRLRVPALRLEYPREIQGGGGNGSSWYGFNVGGYIPQDVRNISSPFQGWTAYHDGSGSNTEGLAAYNGSSWISQVDGSTIS